MTLLDETGQQIHNFMAWEAHATRAQWITGATWYETSGNWLRAVAKMADQRAELGPQVAAVLSPQVSWDQVRRIAAAALHHPQGLESVGGQYLPANAEKARRLMDGASWDMVVPKTSPKVRAFYKNLMGDKNVVTVDTWMNRAASGTPDYREMDPPSLSKSRYEEISRVIQGRAATLGMDPCDYQAVIWLAVQDK